MARERIKSIKYFFENRYEYFYILDFGHHSIKLALLEFDKQQKTGQFLDFFEKVHPGHVGSGESTDFEKILSTARAAMAGLKTNKKIKKKNLVIGMASEVAYGHSFSYLHKRENPKREIDMTELKNAIHNAEQGAYEDIRKKFAAESGYSETEVSLINSQIQAVKIDGYKVADPLDKDGEELQIYVFNAYLPVFHREMFEGLAEHLKISLFCLIYEPLSVFQSLEKTRKDDFEGLIIDIGGRTTRISLARKGRLQDTKTFSFGGESFTRRIASHLNVGFWEAENIKKRYVAGRLGKVPTSVIEDILQRELEIFLGALSMVLKEFSRTKLLPSQIYLHGAGGEIPLLDSIIRKRKWKEDLSFVEPPKIYRLKLDMFENINITDSPASEEKFSSSKWFSVFSMADFVLDSINNEAGVILKTLQRMVKLIET